LISIQIMDSSNHLMTTEKITQGKLWPTTVALTLHLVLLGGLLLIPAPRRVGAVAAGAPASAPANRVLWFRLAPLPEGNSSIFMPKSRFSALPPDGRDGLPDGEPRSGDAEGAGNLGGANPVTDAELAEVLAADREALQAELDKMTQTAMAAPVPAVVTPLSSLASGVLGAADKGPEGAVRELNLEGFPAKVVDDIMKRYKLQVVVKEITGGRQGQSFLSAASRGPGEHYFGGATAAAGVYEVFQLNRDTVALMSRLEEKAIRERGMEPLQTRVIRIVFGIVETPKGGYELGVKSLEAEKVSP
jgi:hypothetical protein